MAALQKISTEKVIWCLIAVCLLAQLHLQFVQQINWDEFFYLSRIFEYQRGDLQHPLQNFHVHYMGWLTALPVDEISQINVARALMWLVQIGTMGMIYLVARPFMSPMAAAISVLAYISAGYVLIHGTSFRTDPVAIMLTMSALAVLVRSKLGLTMLVLCAGLLAFSVIVTVKVVFFTPVFMAVAIWRLRNDDAPVILFLRLGATAIGSAVLFWGLFLYQINSLALPDMSMPAENMTAAYETTILSGGLFPRFDYMKAGAMLAPVQSLLLLFGLGVIVVMVCRQWRRAETALLIGAFGLPLLSFVFYRNAYPYYFAFIFPTAILLVGYGLDKLRLSRLPLIAISAVMVVSMFSTYSERLKHDQSAQRDTLAEVHRIFPDGVNYIDRCSMISTFAKQGFFMSTWGMRNYHLTGASEFEQLLAQKTIPLVLNNGPALTQTLDRKQKNVDQPLLWFSSQDAAILQQNYIRHWGPVWVAGKNLSIGNMSQSFEIMIPGVYTLEATQPVMINGIEYLSDQTLELLRGSHVVQAKHEGRVTLRWGVDLYRPANAAPTRRMFEVF